MPSVSVTPAVLIITWGDQTTQPARVSPGALALTATMGALTAGPTFSTDITATLSQILDTLYATEALVDAQGRPTRRFQQIWQNAMQAIVDAFTGQGTQIEVLQSILAAQTATQQIAAQAAQQVAAVEAKVDMANSRTDPVEGNLTASSAGVITVAAHSRVYGDGTTVAVDGGSVSGFAPGQFVRVYYADAAHAGGAVSYQGTTDEVVTEGATHVVGGVTIPEVGQVDTSGQGSIPPGYVFDPSRLEIPF